MILIFLNDFFRMLGRPGDQLVAGNAVLLQILAADAIAARNTSVYNSSFNDPRYTTFQQQAVDTKLLFSFPDDDAITLACVE